MGCHILFLYKVRCFTYSITYNLRGVEWKPHSIPNKTLNMDMCGKEISSLWAMLLLDVYFEMGTFFKPSTRSSRYGTSKLLPGCLPNEGRLGN